MNSSFLSIHSKYRRADENSNNFRLQLFHPLINVRRVELASLRLPNSFYNVNTGFNTFYFIDGAAAAQSFTISAGSYDIDNLLVALNTAGAGFGLTFSYDSTTFLISIAAAFNYTVQGTLMYPGLGEIIGARTDVAHLAGTNALEFPIYLTGPKNLFIEIEEFSSYITTTRGALRASFLIENLTDSGGLINWHPNLQFYQTICYQHGPIHHLTIALKKEDNTLFDITNSDWTMVLKFHYD